MKRSHAVGASRSFVVCQFSALDSTYAADEQLAANMPSCGISRLTPFIKTWQIRRTGRVLKVAPLLSEIYVLHLRRLHLMAGN